MPVTSHREETMARIEAIRSRALPGHLVLIAEGPGCNEEAEPSLNLLFGRLAISQLTLVVSDETDAYCFLQNALTALESHQVRLAFWGEHQSEKPEHQALFARAQTATRNFDRHHLRIAIKSDSRREILAAAKRYITAASSAQLNGKAVTEEIFSKYLSNTRIPDPDLIIRTSDCRTIPNVLLWEMAYSEFWISEKPWAKFDTQDWLLAIEAYQRRQRRFGGVIRTAT